MALLDSVYQSLNGIIMEDGRWIGGRREQGGLVGVYYNYKVGTGPEPGQQRWKKGSSLEMHV